MHWGSFGLAVGIASVVASLTDWLFMGVLIHEKYMDAPGMWRAAARRNEPGFIVASQVAGVVSCAAIAGLCLWAGALTLERSLAAAVLAWLAGPAVVLGQMVLWTKLNPLVGASHAAGWLVRFAVTAALASWLM